MWQRRPGEEGVLRPRHRADDDQALPDTRPRRRDGRRAEHRVGDHHRRLGRSPAVRRLLLPTGFANGTPVIYQAPAVEGFTTKQVDPTFLAGQIIGHDASLHEIYLGDQAAPFAAGDAVIYHALDGHALGGLVDGHVYYVSKFLFRAA